MRQMCKVILKEKNNTTTKKSLNYEKNLKSDITISLKHTEILLKFTICKLPHLLHFFEKEDSILSKGSRIDLRIPTYF